MATYTFTISDAQEKGFKYNTIDPQSWVENLIENKARQGIDSIYEAEIARMTADPDITSIPANKEQVVLDADVMSAADRHAQDIAQLPA
jgi:hypothetical protein